LKKADQQEAQDDRRAERTLRPGEEKRKGGKREEKKHEKI